MHIKLAIWYTHQDTYIMSWTKRMCLQNIYCKYKPICMHMSTQNCAMDNKISTHKLHYLPLQI